eukprot:gene14364-16951_t
MPLCVRYDLERAKKEWKKESLNGRAPSLWRYRELLPVRDEECIVSLGEGMSPLWRAKSLEAQLSLSRVLIKDESQLPTGTFKSRGASVALSRAKELGARKVALPTNGNAGGAWAAYGARGGVKVVVAMPIDGTPMAREESIAYGADVMLINGLINDCGKVIQEYIKMNSAVDGGCFEVSTLKEPYRLEGKKTIGLEIAEQLQWKLPDVIVYPTGGGVGLIAIYKAFQELIQLGLEGAAAVCGLVKASIEGYVQSTDTVVVINTGSGLKTPAYFSSVVLAPSSTTPTSTSP